MKNRVDTAPNVVFFDLDNTLYNYETANDLAKEFLFSHIAVISDYSKSKIAKEFDVARAQVKERLVNTASGHNRILYISQLLSNLNITPRPSLILELEGIYWTSYLSKLRLEENCLEFIMMLRQRMVRTVLVTDLTSSIQMRKLVRLGLDDSFDLIVTSEEAGGDKITLLPFILAEARLGNIPRNIAWYIGDTDTDFPAENSFNSVKYFKKIYDKGMKKSNKIGIENFRNYSQLISKLS